MSRLILDPRSQPRAISVMASIAFSDDSDITPSPFFAISKTLECGRTSSQDPQNVNDPTMRKHTVGSKKMVWGSA